MRSRLLAAAAIAAIAGAVVAAAILVGRADSGSSAASSEWRPLMVGLCGAASRARGGDEGGAEDAFLGVHEALHALVVAAGREAGAPLLRSKFLVEQAFRDDAADGAHLAALLRSLSDQVRQAGAAAGDDPGTCP